ncbi:MAG TPA: metallophosphoesterase [Acidimicrobiales bacterium]|nr:metallophosphoesterase [Acidimicrobiales bacterium]
MPDTEYHYSVSNDGVSWGPDTTFQTGKTGLVSFRFATGDEESYSTGSQPIMQSIASLNPDFTIVAGDLSYASDDGTYFGVGTPLAYTPSLWDSYFSVLGSSGGQSIPWMVGPGNHDVEPFEDNGFGGLVTRFPHFGSNAATPARAHRSSRASPTATSA